MMFYFDPTYYLYALPGIVLLFIAQMTVKSRFSKYSQIENRRRLTGHDAAAQVLREHGLYGVKIERVQGDLTDHYDPRENVVRLSETVYDSPSIAAVGVAAHEAGHAVQYAKNYAPIKIRAAIVRVCNFGATLGPILAVIGFILSAQYESNLGDILSLTGILLFATVFVFQLVTLPVEFNASRRALETLERARMLYDEEEQKGARKVLAAAAMTYVAAMFQSLLILLYYISRFNRRR